MSPSLADYPIRIQQGNSAWRYYTTEFVKDTSSANATQCYLDFLTHKCYTDSNNLEQRVIRWYMLDSSLQLQRILVVDNDLVILRPVKKLDCSGLEVFAAASGQ